MSSLYALYTGFLITTLATCLYGLIFFFKFRTQLVARAYMGLVIVFSVIAFAMLFSMYSPNAAWAAWWHGDFRLAGYAFLSAIGFWFIYTFVQQLGGGNERGHLKWILPFPTLSALISLTNPWHKAMFGNYVMVKAPDVFVRLSWTPGWWFWIHTLVAYCFSAGTIWLLWRWARRTPKLPRLRGAVMLASVFLLVVPISLDTFGITPAPGFLWMPISVGVLNIVMMVSVWYLNLFDVLPIARETLPRQMSDIIFILDVEDRILDINPAGEKAFGVNLSDIRGKDILGYTGLEALDFASGLLLKPDFHGEATLIVQGLPRQFDVVITGLFVEGDLLAAKLVVLRDITGRKKAEEALRASEEKHRLLFETLTQGVVYQSANGQITAVNPAAERILGFTQDELQGETIVDPRWRAIHADGAEFPVEAHPALLALRTARPVMNTIMGIYNPSDAAYRWLNINAVPQFKSGEKTPYQVYTTFEDITELRKLREEERELAAIEERQRLARELHDAVSQTLFSARLTSEMLLRQKDVLTPEALWNNIQHFSRLVKSALGEMRILLLELRPEGLVNTDLSALLAHLVDSIGSRTDAHIALSVDGQVTLPVDVKIAFYRIAQEALNNIIKHAYANQIVLSLELEENAARLTVEDNGRGFELALAVGDHFGLSILQERANAVGATLQVNSQVGQGTVVSCAWPKAMEPARPR